MRLSIYLFIITLNALALDQSDIDLIDQFDIVPSKVRMQDGEWGINEKSFDTDDSIYSSTQFKDLNDWQNIDAKEWFDLDNWIKNRELKDQMPDWRVHLRNKLASELMGRVVKCLGSCAYYHKLKPVKAEGQTILREGDEFVTKENSYAWIMLVDGTLIRVSPKTSLSFTEINISDQDIFSLIRLNHGHLNMLARRKGEYQAVNKADTDLAFYPLRLKKANREYYAMQEYRKFSEAQRLIYEIVEHPGYVAQTNALNQMINQQHEKTFTKTSSLYVYTPNFTVKLRGLNLSMFYALNGQGHVKVSDTVENFKETDSREKSARLMLRGYSSFKELTPQRNQWYEIDSKGREAILNPSLEQVYGSSEGMIKRLITLSFAREILIEKHSVDLLREISAEKLTKEFGYRRWTQEEQIKRRKFLDEYIRRTETTNLLAIAKVFREFKIESFDKSYYAYAMKKYYQALRNMHTESKKAVSEMNDNEYYLWILKNG
ncbi:MAG: hypothetical protein CME62_09650 [Halobacteriovoraceae bacterium]|nr:hypothetical protein [Halobacteriovoraceae bacterium]|tara:strand:- start:29093 stop:30559 length:1467 start_codon:yes stop_codon:yes gene_type:complete